MHKAKTPDGRANLCGNRVAKMRKAMKPKCSQRKFAEKLQLLGLDLDKNAIQKLEELIIEKSKRLSILLPNDQEESITYIPPLELYCITLEIKRQIK